MIGTVTLRKTEQYITCFGIKYTIYCIFSDYCDSPIFLEEYLTMAFSNQLSALRKIGRKAVLPTNKIQSIVLSKWGGKSNQDDISTVIDFGAGTLYWSYWFAKQYRDAKIYAVDSYYAKHKEPVIDTYKKRIILLSDLQQCNKIRSDFDILWCCDVIHHLDNEWRKNLFDFIKQNDIKEVIIKDIDCRHKIGNFMNKFHDRIINHEKVKDVDSIKITKKLQDMGYEVSYRYIPKLWYSHFILISRKRNYKR